VWHPAAEGLAKFAEVSRSITFAKGKGLPGRVWGLKEQPGFTNVTHDPNFRGRLLPQRRICAAHFAFPLFAGREVNGVIELLSHKVVEPDPDLLQMVEAFGSQIGLFIERRRIQRELQREKENAEAANAPRIVLATLSHELRTPLTPVLIWAGGTLISRTSIPRSKKVCKWFAATSNSRRGLSMTTRSDADLAR